MNTNSLKPRHENLTKANDPTELAEVKGDKDQFFVRFVALCKVPLCAALLVLPAFGAQAGVVFTTLHSFGVSTNGAFPSAGLVQGSDGNFYGTTQAGGTNSGPGTVFEISTNGALTTLYSFTGGNDGENPEAGLVEGSDGNFYGTTYGSNQFNGVGNGFGTVFKISTDGVLISLYSFTGTNDGANPVAGLVLGSDGYFYGTTSGGGTYNGGTVFKISPNGALTSLHSFTGGNDGARPRGLVQGSDGNFYGTTSNGGTRGSGNVFKISANGGLTSLYSFTGGAEGEYPYAGLVQGSDGNLYGTTLGSGTNINGSVFRISTNGALTTLHLFTGTNDGANPAAGLVQGNDGSFYGTTYGGGTNGDGTVFKISPNGALTSLHSFTGGADGRGPNGLLQGSDGYFYGTTFGNPASGTVFRISTNGALTTLYSFTGGNDGGQPAAGLKQDADGNFYGTTGYFILLLNFDPSRCRALRRLCIPALASYSRSTPMGIRRLCIYSPAPMMSSPAAMIAPVPAGPCCGGATVIFMARQPTVAGTDTVPCSKSAPTGR